MTSTTVTEFASELKKSTDTLLEQLKSAGVSKSSASDELTDADKQKLLSYLQASHGTGGGERKKITLVKKSTSEIKQADATGKARTIQAMAIVGVLGILLIIFGAPNIFLAWLGAAFWGIGVALGFPLLLSAAGEADHAAKRVAFVAFWGYGSFMIGPPLLGFLGQAWGMLNMFYVIAAFLATAIFFSAAAGNKPTRAHIRGHGPAPARAVAAAGRRSSGG